MWSVGGFAPHPPKAVRPWTLGEGMLALETSHRGLRPLDPLPPFRQRQVFYYKDVILPHMCTYCSTIKRNLTSLLGRQIRAFSSLFQIKYRMHLGSQTVYTRIQFYRPRLRLGR